MRTNLTTKQANKRHTPQVEQLAAIRSPFSKHRPNDIPNHSPDFTPKRVPVLIVLEIKVHKSTLLPHFPIANSFQDTKATYGFLNRREAEGVELIDTASSAQ